MCKKVFVLAILAIIAQVAFSDILTCPDPSKAKDLVHEQVIHVDAPDFGRIEENVPIRPTNLQKEISCITLTGIASAGPSGSVSIGSIGISDGGVVVKLVSQIQRGIDVVVSAYTE
ncbi:hypothetical protein NQ317_013142 [Molorchus minor]|uniref:Uncharacterized protein n=1 Tax=Molorchus minor TaxID=1323400 RepID=A0ABQ9JIZ2_9CUCU|nr:hypothetical protein NQ317_013142 [Molorchus minor]